MFTQKFRSPEGAIIEITWREGMYMPVALMVSGVPRSRLTEEAKRWADNACGQRMGEIGEHAQEPQ